MQLKRITVCLALAFAPNAFAAEEATLPQVQVTAEKVKSLPSPSTIGLDQKGLLRQRTNTSDTAKMLDGQPGVNVYSAGGVSSLPTIHGMADDRVRVKVDDMDLISSCPNHMNSPLSYIDPSNVGSVKVYTGITPVSIGGDSIGGTIQVDSAKPQFALDGNTLLKGEAGAFYRSNGNANGGNLSAIVASENLSLSYAGSTAQSANYKAANNFKAAGAAAANKLWNWIPGDVVGSSAFKAQNHAMGLAYRNMNHLVELKLGIQDIPYELYPNQRMDMLSNKAQNTKLRYAGDFEWGAIESNVWHESVKHYMDFGVDKQFIYGGPAPLIVAPGMPMYTNGGTSGAKIKADIALSDKKTLRVGSELQNYRLNDWWPPSPSSLAGMLNANGTPATSGGMAPNTFWNINNGKRDRFALFAELDAQWAAQWSSLLGIRVEQVKTDAGVVQGYNNMMAGYSTPAIAFNARSRQKTDNNLDLAALARYTPNEMQTLEFGYAQKTRSPNLYERYSWSQNSMALIMNNFVGDGNGYLGNIDLKPEVAHTFSATADWHDASNAKGIKVTPYYTYVSNYIDAVRCTGSGAMMNALCSGVANNTLVNGFVQMQYANQSARLYGLDLSGHYSFSGTDGLGELTVSGVLNYVNGKNQTTGGNLYNIMPLNTKVALMQKLNHWSNVVEVQLVDSKRNVSAVRNEVKTGGYGLVNLRTNYEWDKVSVNLSVENVFNKFYSLPLGGAYTGQGMTMSTAGIPWGVAVPGMGRSINAGVNVKF